MSKEKIVFVYSGGLDIFIIFKWFQIECNYDVVCFIVDFGQGDEVEEVCVKVLNIGVVVVYVFDLCEEFVCDYVFLMMCFLVLYEGYYLFGMFIVWFLIVKKMVEIVEKEGVVVILYGVIGKGNDQVCFEMSVYVFKFDIVIVVFWCDWDFQGCVDFEVFVCEYGILVFIIKKDFWSMDVNMLYIFYEGGLFEDFWIELFIYMFKLMVNFEDVLSEVEYVEIEYVNGDLVSINGEQFLFVVLLMKVNEIVGCYGVGCIDFVENCFVGMKLCGVYEMFGGMLLYYVCCVVESLIFDCEVLYQCDVLGLKYVELVYNGFWFVFECEVLQVYFDYVVKSVMGIVCLKLYKGNCIVVGCKVECSFYDKDFVSFEVGGDYNQYDVGVFIKFNLLWMWV